MQSTVTQVAAQPSATVSGLRSASVASQVLWLIGLTALLRVLLAASVGLSVDESYTVAVSRQLALSYFDHPPLHLWLVGLWAKLLGSEAPVLVRLPFIALFAISTWLLYRLSARAFGERSGLWAAAIFNITPQLTLATASWVLPDGPLMCCALAAACCVLRALEESPGHPTARARTWWTLAGIAAGLALLSKYLAGFLFIGVLGFLVSSRAHRRWLATALPWSAALIAALLFLPVLIWNAEHHWVSFAFQGGRALPAGAGLRRGAQGLGGQLAYLWPWTAVALTWALWRAWRGGTRDAPAWLFAWLASGPIVFFALVGFVTPVLPHWPMIGWLFAMPLLGRELARLEQHGMRWVRASVLATAVLLLAMLSLAATQTQDGWLDRYFPKLKSSDPTVDLLDWRSLGPMLVHGGLLPAGVPVAAVSWIDAGKLDYALGAHQRVLCLGNDPREFAFIQQPRQWLGRDMLLVADARRHDWLTLAAPYFRRLTPLPDVVLRRAGQPAVELKLARAVGFRLPASP
jgi:4-amino-4-deoxy-L-arabinose transferase-like glycosyltransferase